jgi:hypothetical protein
MEEVMGIGNFSLGNLGVGSFNLPADLPTNFSINLPDLAAPNFSVKPDAFAFAPVNTVVTSNGVAIDPASYSFVDNINIADLALPEAVVAPVVPVVPAPPVQPAVTEVAATPPAVVAPVAGVEAEKTSIIAPPGDNGNSNGNLVGKFSTPTTSLFGKSFNPFIDGSIADTTGTNVFSATGTAADLSGTRSVGLSDNSLFVPTDFKVPTGELSASSLGFGPITAEKVSRNAAELEQSLSDAYSNSAFGAAPLEKRIGSIGDKLGSTENQINNISSASARVKFQIGQLEGRPDIGTNPAAQRNLAQAKAASGQLDKYSAALTTQRDGLVAQRDTLTKRVGDAFANAKIDGLTVDDKSVLGEAFRSLANTAEFKGAKSAILGASNLVEGKEAKISLGPTTNLTLKVDKTLFDTSTLNGFTPGLEQKINDVTLSASTKINLDPTKGDLFGGGNLGVKTKAFGPGGEVNGKAAFDTFGNLRTASGGIVLPSKNGNLFGLNASVGVGDSKGNFGINADFTQGSFAKGANTVTIGAGFQQSANGKSEVSLNYTNAANAQEKKLGNFLGSLNVIFNGDGASFKFKAPL